MGMVDIWIYERRSWLIFRVAPLLHDKRGRSRSQPIGAKSNPRKTVGSRCITLFVQRVVLLYFAKFRSLWDP